MIRPLIFHLKSRLDRPDLILALILLKIKKLLKIDFEVSSNRHAPKIDILIPTVSKDFELLEHVIASLGKINHEINKIFIVAPSNKEVIEYCNKNELNFVDEKTVLGYDKSSINYNVMGTDRSGWIFQQLLKLSGDKICEMENYFVIDSDTIITSPFSLIEDGKFIFYQNEEWHKPYFKTFKKMFGYEAKNRLSFTSHMMIFNKEILSSMKKFLMSKHDKKWDEVYLSTIDNNEASCVSDYDTYANWTLYNMADRVIERPLYNKAFSRNKLNDIVTNIDHYGADYKTVSFHSYIKK